MAFSMAAAYLCSGMAGGRFGRSPANAVAAVSAASAVGILWGVRLVSPGRAGLLLMMEVVTGLATAAAFAGEPFGVAQTVGSLLIVAAALVEVLPARGRLPPAPEG